MDLHSMSILFYSASDMIARLISNLIPEVAGVARSSELLAPGVNFYSAVKSI